MNNAIFVKPILQHRKDGSPYMEGIISYHGQEMHMSRNFLSANIPGFFAKGSAAKVKKAYSVLGLGVEVEIK